MCDFWSEPAVAKQVAARAPVGAVVPTLVPVATRRNMYLHPYHFSMEESAKYGRWPSNVQVKLHFHSIVMRGYESEKEAIEVKFDQGLLGKDIPIFGTEFIDGHTKSLMCQLVFGLLDHLDPEWKLLNVCFISQKTGDDIVRGGALFCHCLKKKNINVSSITSPRKSCLVM